MRAVLCAALLALALLPATPAVVGGGPCPVPDFIAGTTLVAAPGGQYAKVTFEVTQAGTATYWAVVAAHVSVTNPATLGFYGYFAERALAASFIEDGAGNVLAAPGFVAYPYGVQVDLGDQSLRVVQGDAGGCGGAAAGTSLTLAPGTYTAIALGATETDSGAGIALPSTVQVLSVTRGPSQLLAESEYQCQTKARVEAEGFSSEALVGCATPYSAATQSYRFLFVGHFPDVNHQVNWIKPDGTSTPNVAFFDVARAGPGTWTLNIPRYVSPLGQPFFVPGPNIAGGDSGVFGVFADVP